MDGFVCNELQGNKHGDKDQVSGKILLQPEGDVSHRKTLSNQAGIRRIKHGLITVIKVIFDKWVVVKGSVIAGLLIVWGVTWYLGIVKSSCQFTGK